MFRYFTRLSCTVQLYWHCIWFFLFFFFSTDSTPPFSLSFPLISHPPSLHTHPSPVHTHTSHLTLNCIHFLTFFFFFSYLLLRNKYKFISSHFTTLFFYSNVVPSLVSDASPAGRVRTEYLKPHLPLPLGHHVPAAPCGDTKLWGHGFRLSERAAPAGTLLRCVHPGQR